MGGMNINATKQGPRELLFNFDLLVEMDKEKRDVIIELMKLRSYQHEVSNMLESMNLIIDEREATINEIVK